MKLLIITGLSSLHAARWTNQLKDTGWEVHVFQADVTQSLINPEFRFGILHVPRSCPVPEGVKVFHTLPEDTETLDWLERVRRLKPYVLQAVHERYLRRLIEELKPDLIHSLGLNINWTNMCLPVLRVRRQLGQDYPMPWLYSTWGTDLSFFSSSSEENDRAVRTVLRQCDYLATEHRHDLNLAKEMGFQGEFVGYFTGFGGVRAEHIKPLNSLPPASSRKTILLKGRDQRDGDPVARACAALKAFRLCETILKGYRIVIASAQGSGAVSEMAALLKATTDLNIQMLPHVSYEHLMEIYQASRIFISLTVNDGVPSSIIEAMSSGAFPIHSDLESIRELITDGENGFLVPAEDEQAIALALRKAVEDDAIVDRAAAINHGIVRERYTDEVVRPRVVGTYLEIKGKGALRKKTERQEDRGSPLARDDTGLIDLIEKAITVHNLPTFMLVQRAIGINNQMVAALTKSAIDINSPRIYALLERAIDIDSPRIYGLLERAIETNDPRIVLLHRAIEVNNARIYDLLEKRRQFIAGAAILLILIMTKLKRKFTQMLGRAVLFIR